MPKFQALLLLVLACLCSTASAERWQVRVDNDRLKTRLDLDGFKRDGDLLTYRMEMTYKEPPIYVGRRAISTSVIDCRTSMRKHVSTETHFPDGTVRKTDGANRWIKLRDGDFGAGVRNEHCGKVKADITAPKNPSP
jgi:hypothetical protein